MSEPAPPSGGTTPSPEPPCAYEYNTGPCGLGPERHRGMMRDHDYRTAPPSGGTTASPERVDLVARVIRENNSETSHTTARAVLAALAPPSEGSAVERLQRLVDAGEEVVAACDEYGAPTQPARERLRAAVAAVRGEQGP